MKLLLLDRPRDQEITNKRHIEYFGPWAQPINCPDDLQKPRFDPYPTPDDVYNAGIRSTRNVSIIFDTLFNVMCDVTGVNE